MPTSNPDREAVRKERASYVRAARAFANLKQQDIADALGQSAVTVKRMEAGQRDIDVDDLWAIADLCGVPREFMTRGFESTDEELKRIHERFDVLTERISWTVAHNLGHSMLSSLRGEEPRDTGGNGQDQER